MNSPRSLAAAAAILLLCSCGGGGGGSSTPPVLYDGLQTPAVVTAENVLPFFHLVLGDALAPPDLVGSGPAAAALALLPSAAGAAPVPLGVPVRGTLPGLVSGRVTYSGSIESDGTGSITFVFSDFDDGDGFVYDGKLILRVLAYDLMSDEITHALITFWLLTIQSGEERVTLSGTLESHYDIPAIRVTDRFNLDGRDETSGASFRLDDLTSVLTCDAPYLATACSEEVSGRIYLESEGYLDVSTLAPLQLNHPGEFNVDVPDAGGPLVMSGAGQTAARITPLSVIEVQIELDLDGDQTFEQSQVHRWSELVGLLITFETAFGSPELFESALAAIETSDGGYVAVGWANTGTANQLDMLVVKTDPLGTPLWTRFLGGTPDEYAQSVRETGDGGLVVAGYVEGSPHEYGIVYRLDASGNVLWSTPFPAATASRLHDIQPTADGGFIVTGYHYAPPGDDYSMQDLLLAKLDQNGAILWDRSYGGLYTDIGQAVIEAAGGGFVAVGSTETWNDGFDQDLYLLRTDADGNLLWSRQFGGAFSQYGYDLLQEGDGRLVLSGYSDTMSTYVYTLHWVDGDGQMLASTTFGETFNVMSRNSLGAAGDGGYVVAGSDFTGARLYKLSGSGLPLWEKTFNWSPYVSDCGATSVEATSDGGYVLGGWAWPTMGSREVYLVKTDGDGNL